MFLEKLRFANTEIASYKSINKAILVNKITTYLKQVRTTSLLIKKSQSVLFKHIDRMGK